MQIGKLLLPALAAALLVVVPACVARETSFWSRLAAIEKRAVGTANHPASVKCTHPVPRVSFYTLTVTEQTAWISSFQRLHTRDQSIFVRGGSFMDDLAMVHIGLQEEMHYNACFLACHTAFLRAFYTLMRVNGYRGREAYWDVAGDYPHGMQNARLWRSFGTDDGGKGGSIPNGPFKGLTCGILPDTKKPGYSIVKSHYVTRQFNSDWNAKPLTRGDMYTSHFNATLYTSFLSAPNYTKLRLKLEATVHAWIHQSIGGEMWLFSAVCEPAFWLLHAEIDRYWRSWQHRHNAWFDYEGHRRIRKNDGTTEYKLATLDDTIDFYGLFEKVQVRDVMHPRRGILCYQYDRLLDGTADTAA